MPVGTNLLCPKPVSDGFCWGNVDPLPIPPYQLRMLMGLLKRVLYPRELVNGDEDAINRSLPHMVMFPNIRYCHMGMANGSTLPNRIHG